MTFNLTDTVSYEAYFRLVAQKNKLLGSDKYIYGDIESGQKETFDWLGAKLWVWPSMRAPSNPEVDNFYLKREGSLFVCKPRPERFEDREPAYESCEYIVKQIVSKIFMDYTDNVLSTNVGGFVFTRYESTIGSTHFIGCELTFNWDDPDGFEYNEDDWLE